MKKAVSIALTVDIPSVLDDIARTEMIYVNPYKDCQSQYKLSLRDVYKKMAS